LRPQRGVDNGTDDDVNNVDNNDVNSRCRCHKTFSLWLALRIISWSVYP
jgi:hypothetical protein